MFENHQVNIISIPENEWEMTWKTLLVEGTSHPVWLGGAENESRWLWNQQFWSLKVSYYIFHMIQSEWLGRIVQPINLWREGIEGFFPILQLRNLRMFSCCVFCQLMFWRRLFLAKVKALQNDWLHASKQVNLDSISMTSFHDVSGVWLGF